MVLHYNPDKKPEITVSEDIKRRLQELKTKYRLHSFSDVIERLLDEREKKNLPLINPPQNLFCPGCGHTIEGKPRFCHMCGTKL